MPSFTSIFICLLAASSILAAPVAENVLEARKSKTRVCGVEFREHNIQDKCPLDSVFTLKDKSTINKETKTKEQVHKGFDVDHVVEIQMLQKVADDSKLCDILNELHHVDKHKSAETLLKAAKGTFNGSPNLFLVDKKVHSRKETVTERVLKSKKQQSKDIDHAVKNYLQQVNDSGTKVASSLDTNFSDIINTAKDAVKSAQKGKADKLQKALDAYKSSTTVSDLWSKELKAL